MLQPRIKMLIHMKEAGEEDISKRSLMEQVGVCSRSIHNWRTTYTKGGIGALLFNGKLGMAVTIRRMDSLFDASGINLYELLGNGII